MKIRKETDTGYHHGFSITAGEHFAMPAVGFTLGYNMAYFLHLELLFFSVWLSYDPRSIAEQQKEFDELMYRVRNTK